MLKEIEVALKEGRKCMRTKNKKQEDEQHINTRNRGAREIDAVLGSAVRVENAPTSSSSFFLIEHLVDENLADAVLQQRRPLSIELVPGGAGAGPAGLGDDEGDGLVAGNGEGGDDGVDHDVKEVTVADAGGEVVAEVEGVFLEERDAEGDLGPEAVQVVGVEVDQERRIRVLQEL
ncbi:hypothetical protein CR513_20896, partial [Mucuna pruriens]